MDDGKCRAFERCTGRGRKACRKKSGMMISLHTTFAVGLTVGQSMVEIFSMMYDIGTLLVYIIHAASYRLVISDVATSLERTAR